MSSWLGAIAKGAAYLYGGGGDDDQDDQQQNDDNNNTNNTDNNDNNEEHEIKSAQEYAAKNIYGSAKGELWKFNPKREEFKLLVGDVEALVIEHDTDNYSSSFQIIRKNGQLLFSETISNELQIQYNKVNYFILAPF